MEFKCGLCKVMKNKIIWAVLHLQTKEKEKISSWLEVRVVRAHECQPLISLTFYGTT